MNRAAAIFIPGALAFASLCGCSHPGKVEKPLLAASVEPEAELVRAIAGDSFEVVTVLEKGGNPETFEPGMNKRLALDRARVYFSLGGLLPFEKSLEGSLGKNVEIIDAGKGIEYAYGTHGGLEAHRGHMHDGDPDGADPHVWTSAVNLAVMVDNINETLCRIYPEQSEKFSARSDSMLSLLDSIDESIRARLADAPSRTFAVWHPSLSYFARDYGLTQIALGQEHKELSARRLKELIDSASSAGVRVFFFQREFDSRQAETANTRIGSRLVSVDPLSGDWFQQLNLICDELTKR